jgi:hypothetical protein
MFKRLVTWVGCADKVRTSFGLLFVGLWGRTVIS